jgi:hypothetical protein
VTRDELVQAAIEALGEHLIHTSCFEGEEVSTGNVEEIAEIVVDTVLAKLGD